MIDNIKVFKIRPEAKLPHRAHETDAGADLFYCPDPSAAVPAAPCYYSPEDGKFQLGPGATCLVPTGIAVDVPFGYMMEIKNKSGIAFKRQLIVGACVVDPGYDGEVYVNLHNIGPETQIVEPGQKIAQAVLVPVSHCSFEEVRDRERMNIGSTRGEGGFGSTGER